MPNSPVPPPPPGPQFSLVYPPAPVSAPVPRKTGKKLVWIIVGAVLGAFALLAVFVVAIMAVVFGAIKSSEPYRHAIEVATHDARVVSALRPPLKPAWLPSGNINVNNASGHAEFAIGLQGSAAHGTIYVVADRAEGVWSYQKLAVRVEDKEERIELLPGASDGEPSSRSH